MNEDVKKLLDLNDELHKLVDTKLQLDITEGNNKSFFVAFAIGKAFKSHEAILLLCKNGYGEDAFMLARTLFELMITTAYISQDTTDDRLTRYMNHDWVTRKQMYDYVVSKESLLAGLNQEIEASNKQDVLAEVEAEYKKVMEKYKYQNGTWSDKSIKGMSESVGRSDAYNTIYRLQCTVGHTNARSMNEYMHRTILNIGPNWDLVKSTLVVSFDCLFHIAQEANAQFNWGLNTELEELSKRWADTASKLKFK
ncbi:MAG: hypothetical protein JWP09_441 [Candidatus Taylorbacteria bacterium]|nr:hypothetical protein [Candidatus Taylorbacteria bacterium]